MYAAGSTGRLYGGYFKLKALIDLNDQLKIEKTAPPIYCVAVFDLVDAHVVLSIVKF